MDLSKISDGERVGLHCEKCKKFSYYIHFLKYPCTPEVVQKNCLHCKNPSFVTVPSSGKSCYYSSCPKCGPYYRIEPYPCCMTYPQIDYEKVRRERTALLEEPIEICIAESGKLFIKPRPTISFKIGSPSTSMPNYRNPPPGDAATSRKLRPPVQLDKWGNILNYTPKQSPIVNINITLGKNT